MTFSRYLIRLLWHWSFPLLLGAVLGFMAGAVQLLAMADVVEAALDDALQVCMPSEGGK